MTMTSIQDPRDAVALASAADLPEQADEADSEAPSVALGTLAEHTTSPLAGGPLVAECVSTQHPTLTGRALCRITSADGSVIERWLPTLAGLAVRDGDRVLLIQPVNYAEPIVTGVLDGFTPRPERSTTAAATRTLLADEVIRFESHAGEPIVEMGPGELGPVVRLLGANVTVETAGSVRLSAGDVELRARSGSVRIAASDDVVVEGEAIRLN